MLYYFDSSAVVKRYAPEKGSEWVTSIAAPVEENVAYLSHIGVVEVAAALHRKARTEELHPRRLRSGPMFVSGRFAERRVYHRPIKRPGS